MFIFIIRIDQTNQAQIFLTFYILRLKIFLENADFLASAKNNIFNNHYFSLIIFLTMIISASGILTSIIINHTFSLNYSYHYSYYNLKKVKSVSS